MKTINGQNLTGERALFKSEDLEVSDCYFHDGESPLKESKNIKVINSKFGWKYPLWYCENVLVENTLFEETARSGIWYTNNITISESEIKAPKQFRRSSFIKLFNVDILDAKETMWNCHDIDLKNCYINGDYFAMNSYNINCENIKIDGNYCFDGGKNIVIRNAILNSKDSFWNCENVTVYDSTIVGEYLGWNSKNITFINCNMESLQGFCYMENLKLVNCKLKDTTLAFEYSTIDADITSKIDSVKNPNGGIIRSEGIDELILDENIKTSRDACKYEVKECITSIK